MTDAQSVHDADVLFPDVELTLGNTVVTVREFRFLEGMKIAHRVSGLLQNMASRLGQPESDELSDLGVLFAEHEDDLLFLLQASTHLTADGIRNLSDSDGQKLLLTFWGVNKDFFINRLLLLKLAAARKEKQQAPVPASP